MELGAIFLVLAVLVLVGMYLYAPFATRLRRTGTQESPEISSLMAERDRVISSLQELDFDYNLGKIPAEDYPAQRSALLQKGAEILRKLDDLAPSAAPAGNETNGEAEAAARLEKAATARRTDAGAKTGSLNEDDLESLIAARRKQHKDKSVGFCPRCGKPVMASDKFCPSCGKSLQ
jgi:rubrerythrin